MSISKYILSIVCIAFLSIDTFAQFNKDLDSQKGHRRSNTRRDDLLWHSEAANTQYRHAGNASLTTATRWGVTDRIELSTFAAFDFFQPNLAMKFKWNALPPDEWFFASKINIGNAYPGLHFAQTHNKTELVNPDAKLPIVGELGHEFIVSRRHTTDLNCSDGSEWLIITTSIGTYWGIDFKDGNVTQIPKHFLANRSMVLIDNNFLLSFKLWGDWKVLNWLLLHGGTRFHHWNEKKAFAFELQAEGEVFITTDFSARAGVAFSAANYKSTAHKCGAVPIVDFTYYFGKKKSDERSLFNPNGKLY